MSLSLAPKLLKPAVTSIIFSIAASTTTYSSANDSFAALPDNTPRIIGGADGNTGQFPYIVGLVRVGSNSLYERQFCGASIINQKWILSAAHCFVDSNGNQNPINSFKAVVGLTNLADQGVTEYAVKTLVVHENYDAVATTNDIALIELQENLPASALVSAVSLYSGTVASLTGEASTAIGWGASTAEFPEGADPIYGFVSELQYVGVPIVSQEVCDGSYPGIPDTQVCAGVPQGGIDSCVGDSGGPLVITKNGETAQVGVVSYGRGCALEDFYGVYTNVGSYIDWIANSIPAIRTVGADGVYSGDITFGVVEVTGEPEAGPEPEAVPETEPEVGNTEAMEAAAAWWLVFGLAGIYLHRRIVKQFV